MLSQTSIIAEISVPHARLFCMSIGGRLSTNGPGPNSLLAIFDLCDMDIPLFGIGEDAFFLAESGVRAKSLRNIRSCAPAPSLDRTSLFWFTTLLWFAAAVHYAQRMHSQWAGRKPRRA